MIFLVVALVVSISVIAKEKAPFIGWDKLDMVARDSFLEWQKAVKAEAEVMVRTTVPVKKAEKIIFDIIGFKHRSVIPYKDKGSIVTGSIPMEHIDELAKVEFVDYIEGAMRLTPKVGVKKGPGIIK